MTYVQTPEQPSYPVHADYYQKVATSELPSVDQPTHIVLPLAGKSTLPPLSAGAVEITASTTATASPETRSTGSAKPDRIDLINEAIALKRATSHSETVIGPMVKNYAGAGVGVKVTSQVAASELQLSSAEYKKLTEIAEINGFKSSEELLKAFNDGTRFDRATNNTVNKLIVEKREAETSVRIEGQVPKAVDLPIPNLVLFAALLTFGKKALDNPRNKQALNGNAEVPTPETPASTASTNAGPSFPVDLQTSTFPETWVRFDSSREARMASLCNDIRPNELNCSEPNQKANYLRQLEEVVSGQEIQAGVMSGTAEDKQAIVTELTNGIIEAWSKIDNRSFEQYSKDNEKQMWATAHAEALVALAVTRSENPDQSLEQILKNTHLLEQTAERAFF